MTVFRLRTDPHDSLPNKASTLLLDWFSGTERPRSTIFASAGFLDGLAPTSAARDLYHLGGAVYCMDKVVLRAETADAWTRDLALGSPVRSPTQWRRARADLTEALAFLSGDRWRLTVRPRAAMLRGETTLPRPDAVCLFSGGLDSLVGAIDLLESGKNVILVGHFESGYVGGVQASLARRLEAVYGDRVHIRQLQLTPPLATRLQERPLPRQRETTTRARSLLFVTAGLAVASSFGPGVPVLMPENGYIGINVPPSASRIGSLSTRTTHPYFLSRLVAAIRTLGITNDLANPYRLKTKGEMLLECANPSLIRALADQTVSCAHPESARWQELSPGNCGYCYPCIIRRASLFRAGLDESGRYRRDALTEGELLNEDIGADLRAVVRGLSRPLHSNDILRNGPVPSDDVDGFVSVFRRGRDEILAWFAAGAGAPLRERLGLGRTAT